MSPMLAPRDESASRLTCLKSGDRRTLVRSAIDANDPERSSARSQYRGAAGSSRTFMACYPFGSGQAAAPHPIQNGSSRLLMSLRFLSQSVPNRHPQGALRTKRFFRTSVPTAGEDAVPHPSAHAAPSLVLPGECRPRPPRALQAYLGPRNIQHTVRYTELAPDRFRNFWRV